MDPAPQSNDNDTYVKNTEENLESYKSQILIFGFGKWIIKGCDEIIENGIRIITPGIVAVVTENDDVEIIRVDKQKYNEICCLIQKNSNSKIRDLSFTPSGFASDNLKWRDFKK